MALSTIPLIMVSMLTQMEEKSLTLDRIPILDMTMFVFWASRTSIIALLQKVIKFALLRNDDDTDSVAKFLPNRLDAMVF